MTSCVQAGIFKRTWRCGRETDIALRNKDNEQDNNNKMNEFLTVKVPSDILAGRKRVVEIQIKKNQTKTDLLV